MRQQKRFSLIKRQDNDTHLHLSILSCVSIVGNDDSDPSRARAVQGRYHEKKLHKIVVYRRTRRLNNVHILSTDILINLHVHLSIGEAPNSRLSQIDSKIPGNLQGECHVPIPTENLESTRVLLGFAGSLFNARLFCSHLIWMS